MQCEPIGGEDCSGDSEPAGGVDVVSVIMFGGFVWVRGVCGECGELETVGSLSGKLAGDRAQVRHDVGWDARLMGNY